MDNLFLLSKMRTLASPVFTSGKLKLMIPHVNKCATNLVDYFAAALFYAGDKALLAPSIKGIKLLLQICGEFCVEFDIGLNAKKSYLMYFGKKASISCDVMLNDKVLNWSDECKYLGVILKSGKIFSCSVAERVKKFYRCANAIL